MSSVTPVLMQRGQSFIFVTGNIYTTFIHLHLVKCICNSLSFFLLLVVQSSTASSSSSSSSSSSTPVVLVGRQHHGSSSGGGNNF